MAIVNKPLISKHLQLSCLVRSWITNRTTRKGIRGDVEIRLGEGYVADAVYIGAFQYRWNEHYFGRVKDDRGFILQEDKVMVFESKASRSDFLSTFGKSEKHKNRLEPQGHLHWVVAAKGVCTPDEIPEFWGLLEEYGSGLREVKKPKPCSIKEIEELRIGWIVLWKNKNGHSVWANEKLNKAFPHPQQEDE